MQLMSNYFDFRHHKAFAHKTISSNSSSGKHTTAKYEIDGFNEDDDQDNDDDQEDEGDDDGNDDFMQCHEIFPSRKRKAISSSSSSNNNTIKRADSLHSSSSSAQSSSSSTVTASVTTTTATTTDGNKEQLATGSGLGKEVELFHCQFPNCLRKFTQVSPSVSQ